MEEKNCT